jgi:hypothetical protein
MVPIAGDCAASQAGNVRSVILIAAKNLGRPRFTEILRCAQDDWFRESELWLSETL